MTVNGSGHKGCLSVAISCIDMGTGSNKPPDTFVSPIRRRSHKGCLCAFVSMKLVDIDFGSDEQVESLQRSVFCVEKESPCHPAQTASAELFLQSFQWNQYLLVRVHA